MKFAAGITLYCPTEEYINNLLEYTKSFSFVFVNDNTEDNNSYIQRLRGIPKIIYLWEGTNIGLPAAFNRILHYCDEKSIDFLCTLDQDSILRKDRINRIEEYIINNDMHDVGAVVPKPTEKKKPSETIPVDLIKKNVEWAICSGSFVNVKLLKQSGIMYDEAYFIDRFDADICKQMRNKKVRIVMLENVTMPHSCGDRYGHSILRQYYLFRNRFYFNDKYYHTVVSKIRTIMQILRHFLNILRYENNKRKKIATFSIAFTDYKMKRMGKISKETFEKLDTL
jgi:rhamnosyltransferase